MTEHLPATVSSFGGLLPSRSRRPSSALDDPAWRLCLGAAAATVLAVLLTRLPGLGPPVVLWLIATLTGIGWLATVRMLLLDARLKLLWILWLAGGLMLLADPDHLTSAHFTALLFLVLRRYRPLGHLSSSRRGRLFLLALLCLPLLLLGLRLPTVPEAGTLALVGRFARYAVFALGFFWLMVIVQLTLRARLHFVRLKPKLAIAAGFIAIVPLILVIALGLLASYGALGGRTADRGKDVLLDWSRLIEQQPEVGNLLFGEGFVDVAPAGSVPSPAAAESASAPPSSPSPTPSAPAKAPWWMTQFRQALQTTPPGEQWAPRDTTAFFVLRDEMWLLTLEGVGGEETLIRGWPVREPLLDRLSSLVRGDVGIALSLSTAEAIFGRADPKAGDVLVTGHYHHGAESDSLQGFFNRPHYFGGALLDALKLDDGGFLPDNYLFTVRVRLRDLARDFLAGNNQISLGLVVMLAVLASLFLFVELASLFFGLRIASGITSAVKTLHQGTRQLAQGRLDTRIEVPNEDELGDLAASFNEMIEAVRRGQEELLARERYERELETAREIQLRLLPYTVPRVEGYQIAGISEPTRQVGGDYYDFLLLDDGRIGVAVGDVSGKGIPAALLMANLQASLKGQILHPSSVSQTVGMVNQLLVNSTDVNMFATFFYGELDPRDGALVSTNAGHDPPILCRMDGSIERLRKGGLVLGVMEDIAYQEETVHLQRGDVLVIYTDGITEAQGPLDELPDEKKDAPAAKESRRGKASRWRRGRRNTGEPAEEESSEEHEEDTRVNLFEEERLIEVIRSQRHRSAQEIQAAILAAVRRHTAAVPQSDDITLVVIKRELQEVPGGSPPAQK